MCKKCPKKYQIYGQGDGFFEKIRHLFLKKHDKIGIF